MARKRNGSSLLGTLGVLASFGLARLAPRASVGRLVNALESGPEETSTAAYMALVKLGPDYAEAVLQHYGDATPPAGIVQLLGDMGNRDVIPELERLAGSADAEIAATARESIEALESLPE